MGIFMKLLCKTTASETLLSQMAQILYSPSLLHGIVYLIGYIKVSIFQF